MGIIENAKEVAELVKKYNDLDLYQKIIDLRDEIFNLREENLSLKEKNKELENAFNIRGKITREDTVYYLTTENGEKLGPYCMTCWDDDKKLINVFTIRTLGKNIPQCGRCSKVGKK